MRMTWGQILVLAVQVTGWTGCDDASSNAQVTQSMADTRSASREPAGNTSRMQPAQDAGSGGAGSGSLPPDSGRAQSSNPGQSATPMAADAAPETAKMVRHAQPDAAVTTRTRTYDAGSPDADSGTALPAGDSNVPPCAEPRPLAGDGSRIHFHHVHFNSADPAADAAFFEKHYNAKPFAFCRRPDGSDTQAARTERAYLLWTRVAQPPDATPNTYLEHIGWNNPDIDAELMRQVMLGAPFSPEGRGQCPEAAAGQAACNDYWFYLTAPNGARAEIAIGPGPATMGFGHIHTIMGEDFTFFERATGGAFHDHAIDDVNLIDSLADESLLDGVTVVETRGKPIDHIGYSTLDLEAERARVLADGLEIVEEISFKEDLGFRSFFMKSPKGTWIEIVEDTPFMP